MKKSVFGFDKPQDSPGFLLWQTTITWQRLIKKALDVYNISHAQFVILAITLWYTNKGDDISQSLIIQHSKLDKMTVSKAFQKLVKEGYVKRVEHTIDSRAKLIYLTKYGKELITKLIPIVEKIDEKFFGMINKSEQKHLTATLNNMVSRGEKQRNLKPTVKKIKSNRDL